MRRVFVCDSERMITAEVEVCGPVLRTALENDDAEDVICCAILMALSALTEGGDWPKAALESMGDFMAQMKAEVRTAQLL